MDVYYELLRENDVIVSKEELGLDEDKSKPKPKPEYKYWPWNNENVIYGMLNNNGEPFALNFKDSVKQKKKVVHTYKRILRFKSVVYHLIGCLGKISEDDFKEIKNNIGCKVISSPLRNYNIVYKYLKSKQWNKYYMSIPFILNKLGAKRWNIENVKMNKVFNTFSKLHYNFNKIYNQDIKKRSKVRFPKLQYIALRLLEDQGIFPPYHIPQARTNKKRKSLDPLYIKMLSEI